MSIPGSQATQAIYGRIAPFAALPARTVPPARTGRLRNLTRRAALIGIVAGATSMLLALADTVFGLSCPSPLADIQLGTGPAAALASLGLALWALECPPGTPGEEEDRWKRGLGIVLAFSVAAFGMAHLVRGGGGLPWDDDQFISSAWYLFSSVAPGNALGFMLTGIALLFLDARSNVLRLLSTCTALSAGVVASLVIVGRLFHILTTPAGGREEPMMPGAALALAFVCAGVLCSRPDREPVLTIASTTSGGMTARRLLSAILLLPVLGWLCLRGAYSGLYGVNAVVALFSAVALAGFGLLIWWNARRMRVIDAERQRAERALRDSEERYRLLFENNPLPMWLYDAADLSFLDANDAAIAHYGYSREQFLQMRIPQLWPEKQDGGGIDIGETMVGSVAAAADAPHAEPNKPDAGFRLSYGRHRRNNGDLISVEVTSIDAAFATGGRPARLLMAHDVTEREKAAAQTHAYNRALERQKQELQIANERLKTLATRDGLTGLYNHRVFYERLSDACASARFVHETFSILLLDVDRFKGYNDDFGHPAGDVILQRVGQILESASRPSDTVARYGGEEFAILLPRADAAAAAMVAERMRKAVESYAWETRPITISAGTATYGPGIFEGAALVRIADAALYVSKRDGRNRVTSGETEQDMLAPEPLSAAA